MKKAGLIVGRVGKRYLRFNHPGYALVIAKTRAGKGAGIVIPNLLTYPGSCIVNDIKGENTAITARRRQAFGPVFKMDLEQPFISACFNPLDMVRFNTVHQVDDALELAQLMHLPDPRGEKHWDDKSCAGVAAIILHVLAQHAADPALKNLTRVRSLCTQTETDFLDLAQEMVRLSSIGFVRDTAQDLLSMDGSPEMKSIRSTMEKATRLWSAGTPASYVTSRSDFDLESFNLKSQTLYVCVPEEKLNTYGRFLRVIQGCALMATIRSAKANPPPAHPTLYMLDEAAALGHLEPIETAAGYIAAYARMVLVFQDLDQIKKTYPKANSIIANAGCLIAFGVNDYDTAELLSKNLGHETIMAPSSGRSQAWDEIISSRHNTGQGATGRALRDASEILRLPKHLCLIFMRDLVAAPILAEKVAYYRERAFKGLFETWDVQATPERLSEPSGQHHELKPSEHAQTPSDGHQATAERPRSTASPDRSRLVS